MTTGLVGRSFDYVIMTYVIIVIDFIYALELWCIYFNDYSFQKKFEQFPLRVYCRGIVVALQGIY